MVSSISISIFWEVKWLVLLVLSLSNLLGFNDDDDDSFDLLLGSIGSSIGL